MKTNVLVALSLFVAPALAFATPQPASTPESGPTPGTALALSLGTTLGAIAAGTGMILGGADADSAGVVVGGIGLITLGLMLGPSVGHFYVGGSRQFAIERSMLLVFVLGVAASELHFDDDPSGSGSSNIPAILGFAAVGGSIALAVYDIVNAPRAARRAQERRAKVTFAPVFAPNMLGAGLIASF